MRYWLTSRIKSDGKGTGKSRHGSLLGWLRREDSRGHDASDKRSYNAKDTPQGSRKGLSQDHANKPVNRLGLHIIHDPKDRKVDIIFVHGLGGTSHGTWTKHKDPNLFWPGAFLPLENDISQARISTFGYQADIFKPNKSSILDFAKQLLYDMKFAKDNNGMELGIGEKPIIFVAHSMGGLTVKEAYLQGIHDPDYSRIIKAVVTIIFMSTPHRGADLAETLNRIAQATIISAPKAFISDLSRNSTTVQRINESFRHHVVPQLQLVSFYETKETVVGPTKTRLMIVKKDSSVLGYPGEISRGLDADHNGVCKYPSREDPNYLAVRNYLKTAVTGLSNASEPEEAEISTTANKEIRDLEKFFRISEPPDTDFIFFRDRWVPGTSQWILDDQKFKAWLGWEMASHRPKLLWIQGAPGSGKSVLSSFIINQLIEAKHSCQYFYVRYVDQSKRLLHSMLNQLAFQTAQTSSSIRQALNAVMPNLSTRITDARYIWQHVFKNVIFKQPLSQPLFWVIDGLEECDDPRAAAKMLSEMLTLGLSVPIHLLVTSRRTTDIENEFQKLLAQEYFCIISLEDRSPDFRAFISQELMWNDIPEFHRRISSQLLTMAGNSFLWLTLTVERINRCHSEESVEYVLQQLPPDMEDMYGRMAAMVTDHNPVDRDLASSILAWIACARRNLTLIELEEALLLKKGRVRDLQRSLATLCAGFAIADKDGLVSLVHRTAAEFLLSDNTDNTVKVTEHIGHEAILSRCLQYMESPGLRTKVAQNQPPTLLSYASAFWANHLAYCNPFSDKVLNELTKFLNSSAILVWIQVLAKEGSLEVLLQASAQLSVFCRKLKTVKTSMILDRSKPDMLLLVDGWATELGRLVGKFGSQLLRQPESIFTVIPPFCPANSMLRKQFLRSGPRLISVSTTSDATNWEDGVATLSLESGNEASGLVSEGPWVALMCHNGKYGKAIVYHSATHQRHRSLDHGERLWRIQINILGTLLVTIGLRNTKVWDISSGICVRVIQNPIDNPRPETIIFSEDDESLTIGTADRRCWSIALNKESNVTWNPITRINEIRGDAGPVNSPTCMAISPDGKYVALGYRVRPLSVWDLSSLELFVTNTDLMRASHIIWHPDPSITQVFGIMLHLGGRVFKWHLDDPEPTALYVEASSICISHDGALLALGDHHGNVKLLNTADLSFVHCMAAQDAVIAVSFSMDSRYLYDLRYSHANVWQPSLLLRLAETTTQPANGCKEAEREPIESTWEPSEILEYTKVDPITALGAQVNGTLFCSGTLKGGVRLHSTSGKTLEQIHSSSNFFDIQQIVWSNSGKFVCYADVSRTIFLEKIDPETASTSHILQLRVPSLRDNIEQILFDPSENLILVGSRSLVSVVSISNREVVARLDTETAAIGRFTQHSDESLLLYVKKEAISVFNWQDLTMEANWPIPEGPESFAVYGHGADAAHENNEPRSTELLYDVVKVFAARVSSRPSSSYMLVATGGPDDRPSLRLIELNWSGVVPTVKIIIIPSGLRGNIRCVLGLHINEAFLVTLVFLDHDGWVCSWAIRDPLYLQEHSPTPDHHTSFQDVDVAYHYCLPGDWTSPESISTMRLTDPGILLCPHNGEIAAVQNLDLINYSI